MERLGGIAEFHGARGRVTCVDIEEASSSPVTGGSINTNGLVGELVAVDILEAETVMLLTATVDSEKYWNCMDPFNSLLFYRGRTFEGG